MVKKFLLQRMKLRAVSHAFDGLDFPVLRFCPEHQAGTYQPAVNDNRAGTAIAGTAAFLGPGQAKTVAQNIEKGLDIFNRMPEGGGTSSGIKFANITILLEDLGMPGEMLLDSSCDQGQNRVETTGYPSAEYDPWTAAYPDGIDPNIPSEPHLKSGSDGILDWVIIEVTGGADVHSDSVKDTYTYGGT